VLRTVAAVCLASCLALACGTAPSAAPTTPRPDLAAELVALGERALAAGDLPAAEDRFTRALVADPASVAAREGLGRTALRTGDLARAKEHYAEALALEPSSVDARVGLARVAEQTGHREEALEHLERALVANPWRAEAHAGLAALTGPAPRGPADLDEALRRANAHPYDLAAGLAAASALADAGRTAEAARRAESLLWLADLDPQAAREAWSLLVRLEPARRAWRLVPVHSWADESIRGHPGWRFRVRLAWLGASRALGPLLETYFVPAAIGSFTSQGASDALDTIDAAFRAQTARAPAEGVLAAFTERAAPRAAGPQRLGQADFLGRHLIVRLVPEAAAAPAPSHVLLHEVLHLYGAVHVAPDIASLMNPSGDATGLDRLNARIVRETRARSFRGDLERDVLDRIDLEATTLAYEDAMRANIAMRRAGLVEALQTAATSPVEARRTAARVRELDPHLGDVARFVALLLWRGDKPASAAMLLETAAQLYGPRTVRGREAAAQAETIWRQVL
jgi:tetratricopeptide (TPR) repeat protein